MDDSRVRILIVEDDSEALRELSSRLTPDRFRVATCSLGPAVFEFVRESAPDFVVFDARVLYLQGVALSKQVRDHSARTRVLYLDVDGTWSLFLEPLGGDGSETRINPCVRKEVVQTIASITEEAATPAVSEDSASEGGTADLDWRSCLE